jgi:hypothetical protein
MIERLETVEHLSCREFTELSTDFREGALSPHVRSLFEEHLAFCDGCVRYDAQLAVAERILARLEEQERPGDAPDPSLLEAFRDARRGA